MTELKKSKLTKYLVDALFIIAGCSLLSFAITVILKPNHLITGGITGLSIVLESVTGVNYTLIYYGLSLIVLLATYLTLGKGEGGKILLLTISFPLVLIFFNNFLFVDSTFNLTKGDMFLSSIYYGVLGGLGAGLFLKRGYSSGGTDSIGKILHKKLFPFVSISQLIAACDIAVILVSVFVFDIRTALYAVLMQIVFMKAIEVVLFGFTDKNVKLEIISERIDLIENYIMKDIKRGISKYNIIGGYSNVERVKLVTVCSQRESMLIKNYIAEVDQAAFVSAMPIISVWGKGVGFDSLSDE